MTTQYRHTDKGRAKLVGAGHVKWTVKPLDTVVGYWLILKPPASMLFSTAQLSRDEYVFEVTGEGIWLQEFASLLLNDSSLTRNYQLQTV
jgi:hypothetical protein